MNKKRKDNDLVDEERTEDEVLKESPFYEHVLAYRKTDKYGISKDGMIMYRGDNPIQLCHGSVIITDELYKKDGTDSTEVCFRLEGITQSGHKLPSVTVPASDFHSLNWITKEWGSQIVVMPTQSAKMKLAAGILLTGQESKRQVVYTHLGYLMSEGRPVDYLSVSGPLLRPDIKCEIIQGLSRYRLKGVTDNDEDHNRAINSSINLLYSHSREVTGPLFSFVYLVPILPLVNELIGETSFLLFLLGKTQSGKSTLASLAMSHFGYFDSQTPPTTFASTGNAIGEMAFILKDSVLWVDDYHPKQNPNEANEQNKTFQSLVRMSGDHATRRRLDSNAKLRDEKPPRCVFLVTGEDSPQIGQSGHARVFQLDVPQSRKDISVIRNDAREGWLSRAMSDYISYVIKNYETLKTKVKTRYDYIFNRSIEIFGECRLTNQATLLCLSSYMFFDYAVDCKAISKEKATSLYKAIESTIISNARKQEDKLKQEDPCEMFVTAVKDLLASGKAAVLDLNLSHDVTLVDRDGVRFIGWKDDKGYYLNNNASYSVVSDYYSNQNMMFVVNPNTLWRQLRDSKYLITDKSGNPQSQKKIGSKNMRVLWFNNSLFDSIEERNDNND